MRQLTSRLLMTAALAWTSAVAYVVAYQAPAPSTVWNGVYSEAQAYRGEKVADKTCLGCHGSGLAGGDSGPKLVGAEFLANWSTQSVGELFGWVREAMPADSPGTLSKEDTAAVLAYILKLNNMPAGKQDLSSDRDELNRIEILTDRP